MQQAACVRCDIDVFAALARLTEHQVIPHGGIDFGPMGNGFVDHPGQRNFGKRTFGFGVSAANITLALGKPDLFGILGWI